MNNIVERLKNPRTEQGDLWPIPNLHDEAAEEIEKLRLELDMQQATILVPSQRDDQRRIERLDAALKEALDEAAALRAENEKLREAFTPLLKACEETVENICVDYDTLPKLVRAAAAAIRESGE